MRIKTLTLLFLALAIAGCASTSARNEAAVAPAAPVYGGSGTLVIQEIAFGKDAMVSSAVKNECELPGKLAHFIQEYAAGQYGSIVTGSSASGSNAQVLQIQINNLMGSGGGAWSGAKMVEITGQLTQNGKSLGDFHARRMSGGGAFGAYKGTCSILGRCVKALGKDVAEWLKNPVSGAVLGDM